MTHNQLHSYLETPDGWTGSYDAETSWTNPRSQTNDELLLENLANSLEPLEETCNTDDPFKHEGVVSRSDDMDDEKNGEDDDDEQKVLCLDFCCCRFFPRLSLILIGIVFPLWCLISISALFGLGLSAVESSQEVDLNDIYMANRAEVLAFSAEAKNFTRAIPKICFEIFLEQLQQTHANDITQMIQRMYFNDSQFLRQYQDAMNLTDLIIINVTKLEEHMEVCGTAADPIVDRLIALLLQGYQSIPGGLTFNWIRCVDGPIDEANMVNLRYDAQANYFQSVWEANQQELYHAYLEQETSTIERTQGLGPVANTTAQFRAFNRSIHEASGGAGCDHNTPSSVWFWFTVMTTIGYGNQAPVTREGRAMVVSLGFLSLLLFGLILQRAGRVTYFLFEDLLSHIRVNLFTRPWFLCGTWGVIYFGYMIVSAFYIAAWQRSRLGESFTLGEGYWMSFISFTTIGLGDYFIEPEVLLPKDMISLPFIYLVGLTFFASFLEKIIACFPKGKSFRLLDSLIDRIQQSSSIKRG